ncbi:MAG: helix-turn-helix transcriptional regulator [Oscillospiraceae bacterium]|nr:helix-turn-helix transcriptional regulator [Oscillospiraceae bacterium]
MDMNKVGKRIQQARQRSGMTQSELSRRLGMTPKYISNIECGGKNPTLETFVAIANALAIDANTLLADVLDTSDEIKCSTLWEKLLTFPPEKRQKMLRLMELIAQEV